MTPARPTLIPCPSCGRAIAREAVACPGCGAPNRWTHPAILRFLSERSRFQGIPRLQVEGRGFILQGRSTRPRTVADDLADAVGSMSFFGPLTAGGLGKTIALSVGARHLSRHLRRLAGRGGEAFLIDFSTEPPAWRSTDDGYWADVMEFFGLAAPSPPDDGPAGSGEDAAADYPDDAGDRMKSPAVFLLIFGGQLVLAGLGFCLLSAFASLGR